MDKLRNLCVSLMEKILDWNMEKLRNIYGTFVEKQIWRIYGYLTHWKIKDWKNQRRAKMEWYAKPTGKVEKMFRKIVDWMNTREGKDVMTGIIFGAVGIFAVRIFCFLVCLSTGYPADIWNIFG